MDFRHHADGRWVRLLVFWVYVHSYRPAILDALPVPKIVVQAGGAE